MTPPGALPSPLAAQALARPEHPAVLDAAGEGYTYAALAALAGRRAAQLAAAGLAPAARVAVVATATPNVLAWLHAAWWGGACVVLLPARGPAAERTARLAVARADVWLRHGEEAPEVAEEMRQSGLPQLRAADLAAAPAPAAAPARAWALGDVLACVTTSGSTGVPKPIDLTVAQAVFGAFGSATRLGHLPADVWLGVLPLHHVGGLAMVWRSLLFGVTLRQLPRFDAAACVRWLQHPATALTSLVPTMLTAVLAARAAETTPDAAWSPRLRAVLLGGAPTPPALLQAAHAAALPVAITWGMSEAGSQVATRWPGEVNVPAADAGPPLPFAGVYADANQRLWVTGPVVAEPLRTGDAGGLTAAGRVHVVGRADDVFISGGENVHPGPIETYLLTHPAVAEAAVVPQADPHWGQRPCAHLVAAPGATRPDDAALAAFCRQHLASFQLPVQFVWHEALPRDPLGKLRRRVLSGNAHGA